MLESIKKRSPKDFWIKCPDSTAIQEPDSKKHLESWQNQPTSQKYNQENVLISNIETIKYYLDTPKNILILVIPGMPGSFGRNLEGQMLGLLQHSDVLRIIHGGIPKNNQNTQKYLSETSPVQNRPTQLMTVQNWLEEPAKVLNNLDFSSYPEVKILSHSFGDLAFAYCIARDLINPEILGKIKNWLALSSLIQNKKTFLQKQS
jgi:hypothetical protein